MANPVKRIPEGCHTVTPHLIIRGAAEAMEFYKKAFGAKEIRRAYMPDGKTIIHGELSLGDSRIYLADEFPQTGNLSPLGLKGSPVVIHLWFEDVDAAFAQAVKAGATVTFPLADQFWGDRYGQLVDPYGHRWSLGAHVKDPTQEEMMQAMAAAFCDK